MSNPANQTRRWMVPGVTALLAVGLCLCLVGVVALGGRFAQPPVTIRVYIHETPMEAAYAPNNPTWTGRDEYVDLRPADLEFYDRQRDLLVLTPAGTDRLSALMQWKPETTYGGDEIEVASNMISLDVLFHGNVCLQVGAMNAMPLPLAGGVPAPHVLVYRSGERAVASFETHATWSPNRAGAFPYEQDEFELLPGRQGRLAVNVSRCNPPWPDPNKFRAALQFFGSVMRAEGLALRPDAP